MLFTIRMVGLSLAALALTGCNDLVDHVVLANSWDRYTEDFHYSYPLSTGGALRLENFNGSVDVSGWDRSSVEIDGTKWANTEARLDEVMIDIHASADSVEIRTERPFDHWGYDGARYVIHVPRHVRLESIATTNGPIQVDGIESGVRLRTTNGPVRAESIHGALNVQTSNGPVDVTAISGSAVLHTTNGKIRADVSQGSLEVSTTNGRVDAHVTGAGDGPVALCSSNGRVDLTLDAAREVRIATSNAPITVHLPNTVSADVHVRTSHGAIHSDFDLQNGFFSRSGSSTHASSMRGFGRHDLEGTIGGGGPLLDLTTSNGSIQLRRM